jgi:hypothetical protein
MFGEQSYKVKLHVDKNILVPGEHISGYVEIEAPGDTHISDRVRLYWIQQLLFRANNMADEKLTTYDFPVHNYLQQLSDTKFKQGFRVKVGLPCPAQYAGTPYKEDPMFRWVPSIATNNVCFLQDIMIITTL